MSYTSENFIEDIIIAYNKARSVVKPNADRISRGRSHSISSIAEDLFAYYLAENISKYKFSVDQPITIEGTRQAIYPDILIYEDDKLLNLIDLKMDLGWKRDTFIHFCEEKEELIKRIKNSKCKFKSDTLTIAKTVMYHIVIVSDQNISKKMLDSSKDQIKSFDHVKVYILTKEVHPNGNLEGNKRLVIDDDQFNELLENIQ